MELEDVVTLAQSKLLSALSTEDIGWLLQRMTVETAAVDTVLQHEGVGAGGIAFLLSGKARATRHGSPLRELVPGDSFGDVGFAQRGAHIETVTAREAVRIARLDSDAFGALEQTRPAMALHFVRTLLAHVAGELAARMQLQTSRALDALPKEIDGALVVAARVDHRALSLASSIEATSEVKPITMSTGEGREVYRRSAGLVLLEAARRSSAPRLRLGPSITSGRIVHIDENADRGELAQRLTRACAAIAHEDLPLESEMHSMESAIAALAAQEWEEAVRLIETTLPPSVELLRCGGTVALGPGPLLPSTAMLADLQLFPHPQGLLLDFGAHLRKALPPRPQSTLMMEMQAPRYGSPMARSQSEWLEVLGIASVGHFNANCVSGGVKELIFVSEGFHEKHVAQLADAIKARGDVRIVAVAGPSASGKTTFIRRLRVQLEVNGIHPVGLSLDDYYRDRRHAPRDARGELDLEALEALDLALLDEHTTRLLAGEKVKTARFDFRTGTSLPQGGEELWLGESHVLLMEGIHALNPLLLSEASSAASVRAFVHPATSLPFDRLTRLEPSDVRLLRRIVRDRHQRGFPAADNLARWESVRRAERLSIFPHQGNADWVFDSSLVYEPSVLRVYAERYLLEVPRSHPDFPAAHRLRRLLEAFVPIHPDNVPPTSLLREFIGGSGFSY